MQSIVLETTINGFQGPKKQWMITVDLATTEADGLGKEERRKEVSYGKEGGAYISPIY